MFARIVERRDEPFGVVAHEYDGCERLDLAGERPARNMKIGSDVGEDDGIGERARFEDGKDVVATPLDGIENKLMLLGDGFASNDMQRKNVDEVCVGRKAASERRPVSGVPGVGQRLSDAVQARSSFSVHDRRYVADTRPSC